MTELAYPSGLDPNVGGTGLQAIRNLLQPEALYRFRDLATESLAFHSSEVRPGTLFFAIKGTNEDGSAYAEDAIRRGAVAVVAESAMNLKVPVMVVADARKALAQTADYFYRQPSRALPVVGITGTNGKTTVAHLVRHCLETDGKASGLLGTVGYEFGGRHIPATTTTPDPVRVQGYLREMADRHLSACVMEVSSHALVQERVHGVRFKMGVFLNLTQDHLDYHGDMDSYAMAKAQLFTSMTPDSVAVLNIDSPYSKLMYDSLPSGVLVRTFGRSADAMFRAENLQPTVDGTRFTLCMPKGKVDVFLRMPGEHNVQNALAAAATAHTLGVSELTIATALETARPVRGRLELVGCEGGVRAFVDYAHTPDALEKVCSALRQLSSGKLTVVFGCGGDRDRGKRPQMAAAVARHADVAYMTSDNPRSEDPEQIISDMQEGLHGQGGRYYRVVDRAEAIQQAIKNACEGEIVLVAGKGHETYQVLGDSVVPFDDREVALAALNRRR
ncbi:MAG: UDP-N-acetylmuramoyl-L-alanyl-D-glutamate--2,6-diaminopimelate ligase [Planctomycetota bacterium]|jgi:UDP-N-acetylmuramoyl-L-alanyl-D-glutamate--2,6-diaminopimelate ligase